MKKLLLTLLVAVVAVSTSGCGKPNSKAPISNAAARGQRAGGTGINGTNTGGTIDGSMLQGQVFQFTDETSNDFQDAVKGFLSANMAPEYIGFVEGDYRNTNQATGFYFGGKVSTQQRFNPNGMNSSITSSGVFAIAVYDSFTGKTDEKGEVLKPVSIRYTQIGGQVNGKSIHLEAADQLGRVILKGEVVGSNFEGRMYYINQETYNGAAPSLREEGIGWFRIPACSLFNC